MSLLAIHNYRDTVHLWDPLSGRRQRSTTGNDPGVSTVAFRGDGRVLAVRSTDDTMRLRDTDTGQNVLTFKGSRSSVAHGSRAFDFRTRLVATADSPDIQAWDSATGRHLQKLSPPERGRLNGEITCLAFSPEGRLLAAGESQVKHAGRSDVFPTLVHLWEMTSPLGNG
jgi:WD40 repeat protein